MNTVKVPVSHNKDTRHGPVSVSLDVDKTFFQTFKQTIKDTKNKSFVLFWSMRVFLLYQSINAETAQQ